MGEGASTNHSYNTAVLPYVIGEEASTNHSYNTAVLPYAMGEEASTNHSYNTAVLPYEEKCKLRVMEGSRFESYVPGEVLRPYVRCYVISEGVEAATYKVFPGTELVLGFQYRGQLAYEGEGGFKVLAVAGITGLQDAYRVFAGSAGIGTVLVYFHVAGAVAFFKEPLHELFTESLGLDELVQASVVEGVQDRLGEAKTDLERIGVVEGFLMGRLRGYDRDSLVDAAVREIQLRAGNLRMKDLASGLNISQGPLEKRFRKVVGASPKKFASIVRLGALIKGYAEMGSLGEAAYLAGYYDQAHFIKAFKQFTGETPERFFKGERGLW